MPRLHQLSEPGNGILFMRARHIGVQTNIYWSKSPSNAEGVQAQLNLPPFNGAISGIVRPNDADTRNAEKWKEKRRGSANENDPTADESNRELEDCISESSMFS